MTENRIDPVTVANKAEAARLASVAPVDVPAGLVVLPSGSMGWVALVVATVMGGLAAAIPFASGTGMIVAVIALGALGGFVAALGWKRKA